MPEDMALDASITHNRMPQRLLSPSPWPWRAGQGSRDEYAHCPGHSRLAADLGEAPHWVLGDVVADGAVCIDGGGAGWTSTPNQNSVLKSSPQELPDLGAGVSDVLLKDFEKLDAVFGNQWPKDVLMVLAGVRTFIRT